VSSRQILLRDERVAVKQLGETRRVTAGRPAVRGVKQWFQIEHVPDQMRGLRTILRDHSGARVRQQTLVQHVLRTHFAPFLEVNVGILKSAYQPTMLVRWEARVDTDMVIQTVRGGAPRTIVPARAGLMLSPTGRRLTEIPWRRP